MYSKCSSIMVLAALLSVLAAVTHAASTEQEEGEFIGMQSPGKWRICIEMLDEGVPPDYFKTPRHRDYNWNAMLDNEEVLSRSFLDGEVSISMQEDGGCELLFRALQLRSEIGWERAANAFKPFSFLAVQERNGAISSVRAVEGNPEKDMKETNRQIFWISHFLVFGTPSVWLIQGQESDTVALRFEDLALDIWTDIPGGKLLEGQVQWPPPKYFYPVGIDKEGRVTFVGMNIKPKPRDWSFWRVVYDPTLQCVVEVERERYQVFQREYEETPLSEARALLQGNATRVRHEILRATITPIPEETTELAESDEDDQDTPSNEDKAPLFHRN